MAAAVGPASAQITLNCTFEVYWIDYGCVLNNITVTDLQANVTIIGNHLDGRTNADVVFLEIYSSNTPFLIPQLFTTFQNLNDVEVFNSNLQQLNFPAGISLEWFTSYGNNISRILNGTFTNATVERLTMIDSAIQVLEVNAFQGLGNTVSVTLINNRIEEIAPGTLNPLTSVRTIDFEGNLLSEIFEDTFATNVNITTLYLERNRISAVHPQFARNLPILNYINFSENVCVSRTFSPGTEDGRMIMNNGLQNCFNRNVTPELKRITLEFVGNLSIFDGFGNIIGRF